MHATVSEELRQIDEAMGSTLRRTRRQPAIFGPPPELPCMSAVAQGGLASSSAGAEADGKAAPDASASASTPTFSSRYLIQSSSDQPTTQSLSTACLPRGAAAGGDRDGGSSLTSDCSTAAAPSPPSEQREQDAAPLPVWIPVTVVLIASAAAASAAVALLGALSSSLFSTTPTTSSAAAAEAVVQAVRMARPMGGAAIALSKLTAIATAVIMGAGTVAGAAGLVVALAAGSIALLALR